SGEIDYMISPLVLFSFCPASFASSAFCISRTPFAENRRKEFNKSMDTFGSRASLIVGDRTYRIFKLACLEKRGFNLQRLPYCMRILLENLLRNENGRSVTAAEVEFLANWDPQAPASKEISYSPARVLLQDFTGVPAVVDLAAMRDAMMALGGDPALINPIQPAELVIDHSVQVDEFGNPNAY